MASNLVIIALPKVKKAKVILLYQKQLNPNLSMTFLLLPVSSCICAVSLQVEQITAIELEHVLIARCNGNGTIYLYPVFANARR